MALDEYDKEIERILEYPTKVSKKVVEKNRQDIIACLKNYNAFDDWVRQSRKILNFIKQ